MQFDPLFSQESLLVTRPPYKSFHFYMCYSNFVLNRVECNFIFSCISTDSLTRLSILISTKNTFHYCRHVIFQTPMSISPFIVCGRNFLWVSQTLWNHKTTFEAFIHLIKWQETKLYSTKPMLRIFRQMLVEHLKILTRSRVKLSCEMN